MTQSKYYAHSANERGEKHLLSTHLEDTGARAATFLDPVDCADLGRVAGRLHDLGKFTREFKARLEGGPRVDHSTAGAKIAIERYGRLHGKLLAFCIAGHHAGLANGINGNRMTALADRLGAITPKPDPIWKQKIALPDLKTPPIRPRSKDTAAFSMTLLIRMVFSALVDADYLDTEAHYSEHGTVQRGQFPPLVELSARLNAHLAQLVTNAEPSKVNDLRREVLSHARQKAAEGPGLFTLTVPTGGGKTLTSLAFALDHAGHHRLSRVIYVIPYTSIVEQTASVFRQALHGRESNEADFVIEHHSAFDEDQVGNREARRKLRLAMENWDAPIIVTTAVQFFESLFANRPSRCRKVHNIANSVVILDEAQTLPLKLLTPCVTVLDELARNWRASIVLCTATQPALAASDGFTNGFEGLREIAPDPKRLYQTLRRTRIHRQGEMDDAELAQRLRESPQALCIVNTRRHARELYESIEDAGDAFHLTTSMCARHRRETLATVRACLEEGAPARLVATSLVEAGVDVDFPMVWRAEAGLESIAQAAGRCNREGKRPISDVFVFEPVQAEGRRPPPEVAQYAAAMRSVMRRHDDPLSLEAINAYFREVYWMKGDELDAKGILGQIRERRESLDFPFESIARDVRLIETDMVPVIIPYRGKRGGDGTVDRLLEDLNWCEHPGLIARRLQPYVVQIPPFARAGLIAAGAVRIVRQADFAEQFVVLSNLDLYQPEVGLTWEDPTFRAAESLVH